ncbi:hypothetical protein C2S52_001787 [Perilla frutescens var. hirtella]|nr:hypothetical protein C2S52_001787 [Perilla frutescens var. hirtella]
MPCSQVCMILVILIYVSWSVSGQNNPYQCTDNGNYTSNSTYSGNLNGLLRSLSSNMSEYGFYSSSVGQDPNTANGLALCRADQRLSQCRACVESAARETTDPTRGLRNALNVSNGQRFREERTSLLDDLTAQAANGSSDLKVGAGSRTTSESEFPKINGLVQCTPDFSPEDCARCLSEIATYLQPYVSQGFRLLGPNCNIRYELYSFYNETRLRDLGVLPPLVPPLPPGPNDNNNNTRPGKTDDNTTKVIIIIVVPVGVTLIFAACAIIFMRKRMKRPRANEITGADDDISTVESLQYDFSIIRAATDDFDDAKKLGQGGFGAVYKGKLQSGEEVAVKRLSKDSGQGNVEFKNEVLLVAKLQHRNLVRLLGFSMEGTERVLVYEFVQNASLDQFIFGNVLLYGYMSPEYAMHGQFSIKSDVFSFGVLVLEILSGQRNTCIQNGENVEDLLTLTWKKWREGTAANMIDPVLRNEAGSIRDMLRCMHVGLLCVQENAANRPTMASVTLMLSSSTMTLQVPSEPAFYMASRYGPEKYDSKESNSTEAFKFKTGVSEGSSQNDMSVTELYPR